jgi:hypothetical protein
MLGLLLACSPAAPGPGELVGSATVWRRTFGGPKLDEGWGIDLDNEHLYVSTFMANPTLTDGFVYRLGTSGQVTWETRWGEDTTEELFAVEVADGVVHVGGARFTGLSLTETEALLLRFDAASGALLGEPWRHDDEGAWNEIDGIVIDDRNIYLSGWGVDQGGDFLLARLDRDGNEEQVSYWGTEDWEEANGHMVQVDDRLYVAGRLGADSVLTGGDAVLVALDMPGMNEVWRSSWGVEGVLEDAFGLTTEGERLYAVGIQAAAEGLVVWCWDLDGELVWVTPWDGGGEERARAIRVDPVDDSVVVAANSDGGQGDMDIAMLRLDAGTGELLELEVWGGAGPEEVHDFVLNGDSGYLVGQTKSWGAGNHDALVVRFGMRPWSFPEE